MTYFKEALSAPSLDFKRLRQVEPLTFNGVPIVRRTHSAIESEVFINGRHFLLFLPFHTESIRHIRDLEMTARERSRGPLIENRIFDEELTLIDSLGHKHIFDIVLQELPEGAMLSEAVNRYRTDDLLDAIRKMKARMDAIGFRHNNLNPSNIIVCESGVARPLRYWYAEWLEYTDNDISQLEEFIEKNRHNELDSALSHIACDYDEVYTATPRQHNGITRLCKGGRYGFIDEEGVPITRFVYSWTGDFCEGRAIVAKGSKMGAINGEGKKVIPVIYKSLEFDIETGIFTATSDKYRYLIDYEGAIICRTKIEVEETSEGKEESLTVNF
jgi:hypothetical protein